MNVDWWAHALKHVVEVGQDEHTRMTLSIGRPSLERFVYERMYGPGTGLGPGLAPGQGLGPESTRSIDGNAQEQGLGPGQGLGQGSGMASGQGLGVEGSRSMSMEGEEDPYYQGTTHRLHTSYQHTTMHPINTQLHILLIHLTYPSYLYTRSSYLA